VPTVPIRTHPIRRLRRARAALFCGVAMAAAQALPADAQTLGALRGDVGDPVLPATTAQGIPSPAYQTLDTGAAADGTNGASADGADGLDFGTTASTIAVPAAKPVPQSEIPNPVTRVLPAQRVGPVQGQGVAPEDDPFAATGIRLGSFILRPTVELGLTGKRETTTSESGAPPVVSESTSNSVLADSSLRLQLDSDWARHALNVSAYGRLQRTVQNGNDLTPELAIDGTGRFDIGRDTTLTGSLGYNYDLDDAQSAAYLAATDPALVPAVTGTNDPVTQTFDGSLALRHDFGKLYGQTEIAATRELYGAADLSDGTSVSQSDLDNTVYDGKLRAGFELSPALAPFVEASYGIRRMDSTPDSGGLDRNATRYGLKVGTAIDLGEKLNGEIAAGYIREDIADPALEDLAGLAVDASLNWSPRRETDVSLGLSTSTETSGTAGASGALLYAADLGVTHRIRANLTAEAGLGADYRDSHGEADKFTLSASAALTYWFNRFAGLTTRIGHEQTMSTEPTNRSKKTTAFIGLRLQR